MLSFIFPIEVLNKLNNIDEQKEPLLSQSKYILNPKTKHK